MKLIIAIVHDDDAAELMNALNRENYGVTRMCSSGGFLRAGNTTLLCGVEEERLDGALAIIEKSSRGRKHTISPATFNATAGAPGDVPTYPMEITVGGATVFVLEVEKFLKF
ncbi:MAG: cyclic-di-AMP receptor [Clostridia bacterium]|nr:cyclic-di-AMP receptor [Clostridia bacterium]MBQ3868239.1 cyclic-di-AMP receptor [Clostridia bacterium]MBR0159251.1 cyclic-di-AMP receptor [Clostridia bacterium]MBR7062690.1 cyclic-di-AMP receptor [Clostridia bacterium]